MQKMCWDRASYHECASNENSPNIFKTRRKVTHFCRLQNFEKERVKIKMSTENAYIRSVYPGRFLTHRFGIGKQPNKDPLN